VENLPFHDASFDIVYAWGVLHHTPNTEQAVREVRRVLRPGGTALVLVYHRYSMVGYMLWMRYALLAMRPFTSLSEIYAKCLESPGTKAYTCAEAVQLFSGFSRVETYVQLSFGDLLEGGVGQRHPGLALYIARRLWPRWIVKHLLANHGLGLFIEAVR